MYFKPHPLSHETLEAESLKQDKKACKKYGPCGLGEKAMYLNTFYIDRRLYLPYSCIRRVYKRLAMSKGGFTGKGLFATMPYLVVEYEDDGRTEQRQFNFKFEQNVDMLLEELGRLQPQIKRISAKGEKSRAKKEKAEAQAAKNRPELDEPGKALVHHLDRAEKYLEAQDGFADEMTAAAKAKRVCERTNPHYKWAALASLLGGIIFLILGLRKVRTDRSGGVYILQLGMAAVLLYGSFRMRPTSRLNRRRVEEELEKVLGRAQELVSAFPGTFPVPARYAHPVVLRRMKRIVENGGATTAEQALEVLKEDLKALNSSVEVEQWEYDEVVAVKPLFLISDYE